MEKEVQDLIDLIRQAFRDVPKPSGRLCDTKVDEGVEDFFSDKDNTYEFSVKELRYHSAGLSFLSPPALRHFLPCYIIADLTEPYTADIIGECIVYMFSKKSSDEFFYLMCDNISVLTHEEKSAVLRYIEYMHREYGFDEYIEHARRNLSS